MGQHITAQGSPGATERRFLGTPGQIITADTVTFSLERRAHSPAATPGRLAYRDFCGSSGMDVGDTATMTREFSLQGSGFGVGG